MRGAAHYCDYNAGAPLRPEALAATTAALGEGGNPSSVHAAGRRAKARIESARDDVAAALGARPRDLVFTSGATEALHLALEGARRAAPGMRLILSAIEHDALAEAAREWPDALLAPVDRNGVIDLEALEALLAEGPPALVALMLANNETGAIQPVAAAARLVHAAQGVLLVDAAQALGRIEIDMIRLGADALAVSSVKVGGPPGAGALVLTPGFPFAPPRAGGGQERGARPGTENVPAISGFGAACAAAVADLGAQAHAVRALRDRFEAGLARIAPVRDFRAGRSAAAQHDARSVSWPARRSGADLARSRGRRCEFRSGLFVRKGAREPRARRHGRSSGPVAVRAALQLRLGYDGR
jgi:cysteine desulfurase